MKDSIWTCSKCGQRDVDYTHEANCNGKMMQSERKSPFPIQPDDHWVYDPKLRSVYLIGEDGIPGLFVCSVEGLDQVWPWTEWADEERQRLAGEAIASLPQVMRERTTAARIAQIFADNPNVLPDDEPTIAVGAGDRL